MAIADQLIETFRQEAEELLNEIESVILIIEERPTDSDAINRLFRAVHTLKGSGSMVGLTDVARLSHDLESTWDSVRSGRLAVSRDLIDLTLSYRDQVALMIASDTDGTADENPIVQSIYAGLSRLLPRAGPKVVDSPSPSPISETGFNTRTRYRIRFVPDADLFLSGNDPSLLLDELRDLGECHITCILDAVPEIESADPQACYLGWKIELSGTIDRNAILDVFMFVEDRCVLEIEADAILDGSADDTLDVDQIAQCAVDDGPGAEQSAGELGPSDLAVGIAQGSKLTNAANDSVRVPSAKLDALINLLGELVTNQARLSQVARFSENNDLVAPIEEGDRLTNQFRDIVLNIRMMPIGATFSRFKRLVRDLSGELGKQIDLVTEGAETELDKTVIDRLSDPLVHLIRNSIDHGIEGPEERVANGKSPRGKITLKAEHRGAHVVISIIDDGRGLNSASIMKKAIERGLVAPDAVLSESEIYSLIFLPGFSTAAAVTDVSGRGVGMDVVKREIDALRGTILVESTQGNGARISLSLPLTLAIIEGLLVTVGTESYIVPLSAIEECLELSEVNFAFTGSSDSIIVRDAAVPLILLRDLFDFPDARPAKEHAVVVNCGEYKVALVVDAVIGTHQTVIKSLGKICRNAECFSGGTILGDGNVALIVDLEGIIREVRQLERAHVDDRGNKRQGAYGR